MSWSMVPENYRSDVSDMIKRLAQVTGKTINPLVAYTAWDEYSSMMAAGWLHTDDTEEVVQTLEPHADPGYGEPSGD